MIIYSYDMFFDCVKLYQISQKYRLSLSALDATEELSAECFCLEEMLPTWWVDLCLGGHECEISLRMPKDVKYWKRCYPYLPILLYIYLDIWYMYRYIHIQYSMSFRNMSNRHHFEWHSDGHMPHMPVMFVSFGWNYPQWGSASFNAAGIEGSILKGMIWRLL